MQIRDFIRRTRRISAANLVVAVLALAGRVEAAPAVVSVFEAPVHAEPNATSTAVTTLAEETRITVSEEVTDGWRKVRLPDGQVAWIKETDVRLLPSAEVAPKQAEPTRTVVPESMKPRDAQIYIKDLDHLAELTKSDPPIYKKAKDLADRKTTSNVVGIGGVVLGGGLLMVGVSNSVDSATMTTGLVIMGVGLIGGFAIAPSRNELLDVINEWNQSHTNRQIYLDDEPGQRRGN